MTQSLAWTSAPGITTESRMANFDENEASVDVILSNALIDIRFAPFPGTSVP